MNTTPRGRTDVRYEPRLNPASCREIRPRNSFRPAGYATREEKEKRKFQYLDSKLGGRRRRRGKEKRKNPLLSNVSLPFLSCSLFEQVHGTNEVRVARCNKRLESGPSHVGTSAKPVLRSLGLIGRCWLPNCRAPPLLPSRRGKENCKTVSRENRESLLPIEDSSRAIVENELLLR